MCNEREVTAMDYVLGLLIFVLDVWAIINVLGSNASGGAKIGWSLGIIIFPLVGFVLWLLAGPKSSRALA